MRSPALGIVAALAGVLTARAGGAQTPGASDGPTGPRDKQMATDLFDGGVNAMNAGGCEKEPVADEAKCKEAIDDFRRARELYPEGLGALRNLAYVELHMHRLASAARDFRDLARSAQHDARPERRLWADFANDELAKIAGRVPGLTLRVPEALGPDVRVTLDGESLASAAWNTRLELDPGLHHVHAESHDRTPFDADVTLTEGQSAQVIVVGEPTSGAPAPPPLPPKQSAAEGGDGLVPNPRHSRVLPLVTCSLGLAVTGVGLGFGAAALAKRNEACGNSQTCDPGGLSTGRTDAQASTWLTAAGGALLVGGAVWYFLTPAAPAGRTAIRLSPRLGPGEIGLGAQGGF
jgi:hypothetical protein